VREALQQLKSGTIAKHDVGQPLPVDHTVDHYRRPCLGHVVESLAAGLKDLMPDLVGIYHQRSPGTQQLAD
jgi:hypothetical protein